MKTAALGLLILLAIGAIAFSYSASGQMDVTRLQFESTLRGRLADRTRLQVVTQLAGSRSRGRWIWEEAFKAAQGIGDDGAKARALGVLADAEGQAGPAGDDGALWQSALRMADAMPNGMAKTQAREYVAAAMAQAAAAEGRPALVDEAIQIAESFPAELDRAVTLRAIAAILARAPGGPPAAAWERVVGLAQQINDPDAQGEAFEGIAPAMAEVGARRKDGALVERAISLAAGIKPGDAQAVAFAGIAANVAQAPSGASSGAPFGKGDGGRASVLFARALAAAKAIDDPCVQAGEVWQIVTAAMASFPREGAAAAAHGDLLDQALAVADGMRDSFNRADTVRVIAGVIPQSQGRAEAALLFGHALKTTEGVGDDDARGMALRDIFAAIAQSGSAPAALLAQGLKDVAGIADPGIQAATLEAAIAPIEMLAQATTGRDAAALLEEALRIAENNGAPAAKDELMRDIAGAMAQASAIGKDDALGRRAVETAEGIADPYGKAIALEEIAGVEGRAGDAQKAAALFAEALQATPAIADDGNKAAALQMIVASVAASGNAEELSASIEQARRIAESIGDAPSKAEALEDLAAAAQAAGSRQAGALAELLGEARGVAENLEDPCAKANALVELAALAGQRSEQNTGAGAQPAGAGGDADPAALVREAIAAAREIGDEHSKEAALEAIAEVTADVKDRNQAGALFQATLQAAAGMQDRTLKQGTIEAVAGSMTGMGARERDVALLEQAAATAQAIPLAANRSAKMLAAAADLAALGYVRRARGVALRQTGNDAKCLTLVAILLQAMPGAAEPQDARP